MNFSPHAVFLSPVIVKLRLQRRTQPVRAHHGLAWLQLGCQLVGTSFCAADFYQRMASDQPLVVSIAGQDCWGIMAARIAKVGQVPVATLRAADQTNVEIEFTSGQSVTTPVAGSTRVDACHIAKWVEPTMNRADWWMVEIAGPTDIAVVQCLLKKVRTPLYVVINSGIELDCATVIDVMKRSTMTQIDQTTLLRLTDEEDPTVGMANLANRGVRGLIVTSRESGLRAVWHGEWLRAPFFGADTESSEPQSEVVAGTLLAALRRGEPFDFALAYASAACALALRTTQFDWDGLLRFTQSASRRQAIEEWPPSPLATRRFSVAAVAVVVVCISVLMCLAMLNVIQA